MLERLGTLFKKWRELRKLDEQAPALIRQAAERNRQQAEQSRENLEKLKEQLGERMFANVGSTLEQSAQAVADAHIANLKAKLDEIKVDEEAVRARAVDAVADKWEGILSRSGVTLPADARAKMDDAAGARPDEGDSRKS